MILMVVIWAGICLGQEPASRLTPEEIELLRKYKTEQKPSPPPGIDKYKTPDLYGASDSTKIRNPRASATNDVNLQGIGAADSRSLKSSQLRPFGYEIFEGDQQLYDPSLTALPPDDYTLGPGDNLIVNVWGRVELQYDLTVDREGKVFIPRVGDIMALGCTAEKFRQVLQTKLGQIYSEFQLSVAIGKLRQIRIYVFGEVKMPGGYTSTSLATILNALYLAGGITDNGSLRKIQLIRHTKVHSTYDLYELLLKGNNSNDLKLLSGDVVYVPVTGPRVGIEGEIRRPAIYELQGGETITRVISFAGGTTSTAFLQSVSLDRVGQNDSRM